MVTKKELQERIRDLLDYRNKQVRRIRELATELEETDPDYKRLSPKYKEDWLETRKTEIIRDQDRDFESRLDRLKRDVEQAKNEIALADFQSRTGLNALKEIADDLGISPDMALKLTENYLDQGNIKTLLNGRSDFTDNILKIGRAIKKIPEEENNDILNPDPERPDFQGIDALMGRFDAPRDFFTGLTPFDTLE